MKRFILTFSCIISILWIMPLFVKAETTYSEEMQYVIDYCSVHWPNVTMDNGTKDYIELRWQNSADLFIRVYDNRFIIYIGGPFNNTTTGVNNSNGNSYYTTHGDDNGVGSSGSSTFNFSYSSLPDGVGMHFFGTKEEVQESLIDFDTVYYDPTVPTPNFNVYMIRPDAWQNITEETNFFNISWSEYSSYYIQIGYKYSVPNSMKVGVTDGNKVYTPLSYFDSQYLEIYSLEDMHNAIGLNASVSSDDFTWQSYEITDPESWQATVPPWVHNYNNSAFVLARDNWNNKLALCMPLYGNRLEIFARLFYVEDGGVYVGAWRHWNNSYPSEYGEELPQNYQVDNSIPGYQNTNNNTDYQDQNNTITSIGEETGKSNSTTIINNLTPNYPDYPTAVTYNHDNILLQMIDTTKRLPSFFGQFTDFCKECMTVLPSEIWEIIAFGFLCSILVMIVKVL